MDFLDRIFSSRLVPRSIRSDQLIIDASSVWMWPIRHAAPVEFRRSFGNFFDGDRDEALKSVEIGHTWVRWDHSGDDLIAPDVRIIGACIIARVRDRDDRWTNLVKERFCVPDGVFRDCFTHGDMMLLVILIHVTLEEVRTGRSERGVPENPFPNLMYTTVHGDA